jgi:hypothetical protein
MSFRSVATIGLLALAPIFMAPLCVLSGGPPAIVITSPSNNSFHVLGPNVPGAPVTVTGTLENIPGAQISSFRAYVNKVGAALPSTPVLMTGQSSFTVTLTPDWRVAGSLAEKGLNTIFVEVRYGTAPVKIVREGVTIVVGEHFSEWGPTAPQGVTLRVNQRGLDQLQEPIIDGVTAGVDIESLIAEDANGNPRQLANNQCLPSAANCIFKIDAFVTNVAFDPMEVAITPFGSPSPTPDQTQVEIELPDFQIGFVAYDVPPPLANVYCSGHIAASPLHIESHLDQLPAGNQIDVVQLSHDVAFSNFQLVFDQGVGVCSYAPLTNYLQQTLAPTLRAVAEQQLYDALADPDLPGTGPAPPLIEGAVQTALNGLHLSGALSSLGADLGATFVSIREDFEGIQYAANTAITTTQSPCSSPIWPEQCPDLGNDSFLVPVSSALPVWGPNAPGGALYGLGLGLRESMFNQLARVLAETGGLSGQITEMDDCTNWNLDGSTTLTWDCLLQGFLIGGVTGWEPIEIRFYPRTAPVLPGGAGPLDSQAKFGIKGMALEVHELNTHTMRARILLRINGGISLVYDDNDAAIHVDVEYCTISQTNNPACDADASATTLRTNFPAGNVSPAQLDSIIVFGNLLEGSILPLLDGAFASFPLPTIAGLDLEAVETARDQEHFGLFFDLVEGPPGPPPIDPPY